MVGKYRYQVDDKAPKYMPERAPLNGAWVRFKEAGVGFKEYRVIAKEFGVPRGLIQDRVRVDV